MTEETKTGAEGTGHTYELNSVPTTKIELGIINVDVNEARHADYIKYRNEAIGMQREGVAIGNAQIVLLKDISESLRKLVKFAELLESNAREHGDIK